ncbi:MAG TPA: hypothetical protein PLY75_04470 [Gammaproteobacteria bacterium]|nr:hypothetical protein [Gammaproteobacteria bacterium]
MQASDAQIGTVPDSVAYFSVAKRLNVGVQALLKNTEANLSRSFLAAQALECVLKAFLTHQGIEEKKLKHHDVRHNLEELWVLAASHGANLAAEPAPWCRRLNELHDKPYYFRYPMKLHGVVMPGPEPMASEMQEVIRSIGDAIGC